MKIPFSLKILSLMLFASEAFALSPPLEHGDLAFRHRLDPEQAELALSLYRTEVAATQRQEPEALWRLSMGCYFVGLRFIKDEQAQQKIFKEGRDAGLLASSLDPKCASCRFWAAINMALYGQSVGVFKMIFSLSQIQELLKQSIALDPTYAYGGAERLLGLIYQKVPGIIGGSNSKAQKYFEDAIKNAPEEPLNYLFLSQLLLKDLHNQKSALATATAGLQIQQNFKLPEDRLESIEALAQLQELQQKLHP